MVLRSLKQYGVVILLLAVAVVLLLPLEQLFPGRLPYARFRGTLDGEPVILSLASTSSSAREVQVRIRFEMDEGVLRAAYPEMGPRGYLVRGSRGDYRMRLPREKKLLLDPMGGRGRYHVGVGWQWHPFGPWTRRITALGMLGGMLFGVLWNRRASAVLAWTQRVATWAPRGWGWRHWTLVFVWGLVSGVVLYGVVHEFGHTIVPRLYGVSPSRVVWTILSGEEPHVEFPLVLNDGLRVGMTAGGTLFPSVVALALLGVWYGWCRDSSDWASILLLVPAVGFLFAHVSGPIDAIRYLNGDHPGHMATVGEYLDLGRWGTALLCASPILLTIGAYLFLARVLRRPRPS